MPAGGGSRTDRPPWGGGSGGPPLIQMPQIQKKKFIGHPQPNGPTPTGGGVQARSIAMGRRTGWTTLGPKKHYSKSKQKYMACQHHHPTGPSPGGGVHDRPIARGDGKDGPPMGQVKGIHTPKKIDLIAPSPRWTNVHGGGSKTEKNRHHGAFPSIIRPPVPPDGSGGGPDRTSNQDSSRKKHKKNLGHAHSGIRIQRPWSLHKR